MLDVSYDYDVPQSSLGRRGFTQTLRDMCIGASVEIPLAKKASVYSSARAAGVKVRTRVTDEGTVRVWRLDGPERPTNIFGEPITPPKPAPKLTQPTPRPADAPLNPAAGIFADDPIASAPKAAVTTTVAAPVKEPAPKPAKKAAAAAGSAAPKMPNPNAPAASGYFQTTEYGPRIWTADLRTAPAGAIFGISEPEAH